MHLLKGRAAFYIKLDYLTQKRMDGYILKQVKEESSQLIYPGYQVSS